MQPDFKSSTHLHVIRLALTIAGVLVAGILLRQALLPAGYGTSGRYRPGAELDEANRTVRNLANDACLACHPLIRKLHLAGTHATVSCEICHGPGVDHVQDGKLAGAMPTVAGDVIGPVCLRCHGQVARLRPLDSIRMVSASDHLTGHRVRADNDCDQCHHVHAPMKWVREAREMVGLAAEPEGGRPWTN